MSARQQQIEAIGSVESSEAAGAALAATLARVPDNGVAAAARAEGGSSPTKAVADAVSLAGRKPDAVVEMRQQARAMRQQAAGERAASKQQAAEGRQLRMKGQKDVPVQQARMEEAEGQKAAAQNRAADTGDVDRAADNALAEAQVLETRAAAQRAEAEYDAEQGEFLVDLGNVRGDRTLTEQGAQMLINAGRAGASAKLLYGQASGQRAGANQASQRRNAVHAEGARIVSQANMRVEAAQTAVAQANGEIASGERMISSSAQLEGEAGRIEGQAGLIESSAAIMERAESIPFYVVGV